MTRRPEKSHGPAETLALARVVARLREELADARRAAAEGAVVERAKGLLMGAECLSAHEAYAALVARAELYGHSLAVECSAVLDGHAARPPRADRPALGAGPVRATAPVGPPGRGGTRTERPPRPVEREERTERTDRSERTAHVERTVIPSALAGTLAQVRSAHGAAAGLHRHLGAATGVDCVVIYAAAEGGGADLWGDAGLDPDLARRWRHLPPGVAVAPLRALETGRPVWLEDPGRDAERYTLIGQPERWPTRAWLPCPTPGANIAAVGFLRGRAEPFDPATRDLLQHAARLCGAALGALPAPAEAGAPGTAPDAGPDADADADAQRMLDALPGAVIVATPLRRPDGTVEDFRVDAASPGAFDVARRRGKELTGTRLLERYPTILGTSLWRGFLEALETGTAYEGDPFAYEEVTAGRPRHTTFSVRAVPLGRRLVVSWLPHDAEDREATRLADMQRLGNLGWSQWDPATGAAEWSDQVYTIFQREPSLGPVDWKDLPDHLVPEDAPGTADAVDRLLHRAEPLDRTVRIAAPGGVRHVRVVAEAVADATGAPVEVHGLFQDLTRQRHAEDELVRSERAVAHQRGLLRAERTLAARLQHALLPIPGQSLRLAGLDVEVAYRPAEDGVNVGGDWYSAIELPDGNALFVVGDVAGHGLDAVATMAQLRFTAKGMIVTGSPLVEALHRLNTLLLHTGDARFGTATMIIAVYDPAARCLTWAQAGHPPPLLVRDGRAGYLDRPAGVLLGATADPRFEEARCRLLPGDQVLFYTDGLVEKPAEHLNEGFARLASTAARTCAPGPGETLGALLSPLVGRGARRDDTCVVRLHLP
ncbi:SpoIIE family protein phosphatase [Streptomyces sp. NPDC101132]|uniref:SpoIIE family protein phosphatase n=1 Tax=Streptomyces sp. NPDC101132 TaxID=3366110 RepID=UPI0038183CD3